MSTQWNTQDIQTNPYDGQKPGTSGLRKRVKVFQQQNYTENFIQAIFSALDKPPKTLVLASDGRYFSVPTLHTILRIGAANGVTHFIAAQDGIMSTPAASAIIRKYKADGGILLTASHNAGGPDKDFGIKYNVSNGGPAPEGVTSKIYEATRTISAYKVLDDPSAKVDFSKLGEQTYGPAKVTVLSSTADYVELLEGIFDFPLIKKFLKATPEFKVLFDGLHGVTGPYAHALFLEALGLPASSIQNAKPLPDFGGGHPDPNLTYAHSLVEAVERDGIAFGAASDGDGDRNMIYGCGEAFVTPSDSVAIIADWAERAIPYFKGGLKGLARSMPTSGALDLVAKAKGVEMFEVPTGWKFFGNLMDAGRLSVCGEESFGTGSDHIREKDGVWAVIAWLNVLAKANEGRKTGEPLVGIKEVLMKHWKTYGRSFFSRYDYEEVESKGAGEMMAALEQKIASGELVGKKYDEYEIKTGYNFSYTDPVDGSVSSKQGLVLVFTDGSRVVFRLSGTGSEGATVRMYIERYSQDAGTFGQSTAEGLRGLIRAALEVSRLREMTGRETPTVIT